MCSWMPTPQTERSIVTMNTGIQCLHPPQSLKLLAKYLLLATGCGLPAKRHRVRFQGSFLEHFSLVFCQILNASVLCYIKYGVELVSGLHHSLFLQTPSRVSSVALPRDSCGRFTHLFLSSQETSEMPRYAYPF